MLQKWHKTVVSLFAALYPSISPPTFVGPKVWYDGSDATDFTFECGIKYKSSGGGDDGARFDVVLTFDGEVDISTLKTTTSLQKTVVFNSTDLAGAGRLGKKVSETIN